MVEVQLYIQRLCTNFIIIILSLTLGSHLDCSNMVFIDDDGRGSINKMHLKRLNLEAEEHGHGHSEIRNESERTVGHGLVNDCR